MRSRIGGGECKLNVADVTGICTKYGMICIQPNCQMGYLHSSLLNIHEVYAYNKYIKSVHGCAVLYIISFLVKHSYY